MRIAVMLAVAIVLGAWVVPSSPRARPGWVLYDRYCLACHGASGDGRGPAAPYTRGAPRDLTRGDHAWRTTATGEPPTDDDLRLTLRHGAPGTSMPGFDLTPSQIDELIAVVKAFAPAAFAMRASPIKLGPAPAVDATRGADLWLKAGCSSCHGPDGRGTSPVARAIPTPHMI